MKRRLNIILMALAAVAGSLLAVSCFADLSTEADHEIPDIVIEGLPDVMYVLYGQEIHLEVTVSQEGRTAADLDIQWSIDLQPQKLTDRIELGDGTTLDYKVSNRPDTYPYVIRVDVTDRVTGLVKMAGCKLFVSSSLGEGLLVAYTRDGGATSEFDLLANKFVTWGYESDEPTYTRELYSLANGRTLDEKVNVVCEMLDTDAGGAGVYGETRILVGTDRHLRSIDPLTFIETEADAPLFYSSYQTEFGTTDIFNFGGYSNAAIVNGEPFGMMCHIDRQYSALALSIEPKNFFRPGNVAHGPMRQGGNLAVFNENDGNFYYILGWNLTQGAFKQIDNNYGFQSKGCVCIGAGCGRNQYLGFLLRDPADVYRVCMINTSPNIPTVDVYTLNGPDMDKIVSVDFCDNCDLMYYATDHELYATILAAGRVNTRKVNWTPESPDEKITSVKQYLQGWYGTHQYNLSDYEFPLDTHRLQLIITTYNEKTGEGKIYLRPFNVSTGYFTSKDNGTYGGFGEITAICPTFR